MTERPAGDRPALSRRRFLTRTGQLAAVAGVAPLFARRSNAAFLPDERAVVETTSGKVRGGIADGIKIFRGIPYGAPTGGRGRFLPPKAAARWPGIKDTLDYGDACPQTPYDLEKPAGISWFTPFWPAGHSEDCLVLNLWTPALGSGKRPVLVWLHGGGYSRGSGGSSAYDGINMALRNDVVVITVNHRLNVFGYAHLADHLGPAYESSGNAGMLDIVLALEWVRDNADRFGGDPGNVMIFGESGGGAKVSTLMGMPGAKGLFHRAVVQSGPGIRVELPENASKTAFYLLEELGVSKGQADRLAAVSQDELLAAGVAAERRAAREGGGRGFRPVLGPAVPAHPFDPVASDLSATVPLMIGTNRHEATLLSTGDRALFELDRTALLERVQRLDGDSAEEIIATYKRIYPDATPSDLYFTLASDRGTRMRSIQLAERKVEQGRAPVWMYRFDFHSPAWEGRFRAAHAFEIPFVFGNAQLSDEITGGGPDAVELAAKMRDAWTSFARSGDPSHDGLPEWPAYDEARRATMLFDNACETVNDPGAAERKLWQRLQAET